MIIDCELFNSLSLKSNKKVKCSCDGCKKELYVPKFRIKQIQFCSSCCKIGRVYSDESRLKMSKSKKGREKSVEHRHKLRLTRIGKMASKGTREKMSQSQKARMTDAEKAKISAFHTGKKHTAESRRKMSDNCRKGVNHPYWRFNREQMYEERRFAARCRRLLTRALKDTGQCKIAKTEAMLGYKFLEIKNHIESHQNWENLKNTNWNIDHIFPICAFMEYGIKDMKIINSLDNLQPLSKADNLKKTNKFDKKEFEVWLRNKNVIFNSKLN